MSKKSQTLLIIAGTLIIGVLIGALATGAIRHQRDLHFGKMHHGKRFRHTMEKIINPTDAQKDALKKALDRRYEAIAAIREKHEDELLAVYDSIHADLVSILTEEQRVRLEDHLKKAPRHIIEERMARVTEGLQLSDSQKAQLNQFMTETFENPEKMNLGMPSWKMKRSIKGRFRKLHEKLESILTSEQLEKLHQSRKFGRRRFGRPPDHDSLGRPDDPPFESKRVPE